MLQQRRQQMPLEVMDADRPEHPGIRETRQGGAGQKRPDQAGTGRIGDAIQLRRRGARLRQGACTSGSSRWTWSREASSGTTPP